MFDSGVRKLFGGNEGLVSERMRYKATGYFIIHPYSPFRLVWDTWMVLVLLATLLVVPVQVSFTHVGFHKDWMPLCIFGDFCRGCDVFLTFLTGHVGSSWKDVVLDPDQVFKDYLTSWFLRDLTSCIPWDFLFIIANQNRLNFFSRAEAQIRAVHVVRSLSLVRSMSY
ncbi:unnamed protein product [Notodromas monacha]|uniref:Ion transport N-terminal domain-containing protein n=1 Tax=Notodromas monacha TaxID=399045 RepID=A0A7R9C2L8_9CRUS|nr:unnamed protein product [Notodromas monacha]CAG0925042.1 unnamed protein product [Notodromas monacha]